MPNGKPGDHPFTDIVLHKRDLYSTRAASLVREIDKLADQETSDRLARMLAYEYDPFFGKPDVAKLERVLTEMHDELLKKAGDDP